MELVLVYLLFMFSGCASLIFEVIWFQLLELVFGSTTLAISTILVAYMLGLGVGALFAGRISSRQKNGVRTYGFIEIAIGLYALVVPALVALYPEINAVVTGSLSFQLATVVRPEILAFLEECLDAGDVSVQCTKALQPLLGGRPCCEGLKGSRRSRGLGTWRQARRLLAGGGLDGGIRSGGHVASPGKQAQRAP